ncbi:High-affinity branched-chain amino acid transport system permease protein LivH [Burkholderiales bacterium]|nr:High-affinity branched-chain amino acid transport system permease protein LivH [Burkholderiales bacterium]
MPAVALLVALAFPDAARALSASDVQELATGDGDERVEAVRSLAATRDPAARRLIEAALSGSVQSSSSARQVFVVVDGKAVDAATGAPVAALPADAEDLVVNNRLRRVLETALAVFALASDDREERAAAIAAVEKDPQSVDTALLDAALAREPDAALGARLDMVRAAAALASDDRAQRLAAIGRLADSRSPSTRLLLLPFVERNADGAFRESDAELRAAAQAAIGAIDDRERTSRLAGAVFSGVSLGSVLLLAALGLAITYGLMGVINMAHGELLMVGAYATWIVQDAFRAHLPGAVDWYLAAAIPAAFASAAALGVVIERTVIRFLYGRPLETLLATFGVSLLLIQLVRTLFGAQNVEVANPSWMSGGIELASNLTLPWNRLYIILFSALVVAGVWAILNLTRLGLFVRAVTQNRAMASCVGVKTRRVDTMAFGLGSGVAGLGGCALSQVGNVGPDLGQAFIVDSFMAVVLGGVGQLAGTVVGSLGLGVVSKFLEPWSGAVLAKIAVLVMIVLFIQRRPQGLFALKGRSAEA